MTSITNLANELYEQTKYQKTPMPFDQSEYELLIINGIKTLYIDTGRALTFTDDMIIVEDEEIKLIDTLPIDEEKYVLLVAQINFFKKVQADVNNIVGYTTNALTVTGADKPYAHLQDTITNLENERRIVYYKMVRYIM